MARVDQREQTKQARMAATRCLVLSPRLAAAAAGILTGLAWLVGLVVAVGISIKPEAQELSVRAMPEGLATTQVDAVVVVAGLVR